MLSFLMKNNNVGGDRAFTLNHPESHERLNQIFNKQRKVDVTNKY